jgi:lipoprotein-anchoring transpeptidase ErfK/SrfK
MKAPSLLIIGSLLMGPVAWAAETMPPTASLTPATTSPATAAPATAAPGVQGPAARPASAVAANTSTQVILLSLGRRQISLQRDGKVVGSWPVVIGAPGTPTPTGTFKVTTKVINPKYQSTASGKVNHTTGAASPLGVRWIGFHTTGKDDYGIHGTPWPWWVDARAAVSHGCVRMKNEHVSLLFDQVDIGTPVVIKP